MLGFYVCSVSGPALALGQYADQYRKAQEGHLMSVCRLCLAVLQWLKLFVTIMKYIMHDRKREIKKLHLVPYERGKSWKESVRMMENGILLIRC